MPRDLNEILYEEEDPSVFENLFRFLGRPAYAVRSLITGEPTSAIKNLAQFVNEAAVGGAIHGRTLTGLIGMERDLTGRDDRPEFTDVLKRWGLLTDPTALGGGTRLAIDVLGGIVTDPLSLVGGSGAKGIRAATLQAPRAASRARLVVGLEQAGGELGEALKAATARREGILRSRVARTRGVDPGTLELKPATARRLQGKAAEDVWRESIRAKRVAEGLPPTAPEWGYAPTGLDDVSPWLEGRPEVVQAELKSLLQKERRFALVPKSSWESLPEGAQVRSQLAQRNLSKFEFETPKGEQFMLLSSREGDMVAERAAQLLSATDIRTGAKAAANRTPERLARDSRLALKSLGYNGEWAEGVVRAVHGAQPGYVSPAEEILQLSAATPESAINEGVAALRRRGMNPGSGLGFRVPFSSAAPDAIKRGAEKLGWSFDPQRGYVYLPWSDVASVTAPGLARKVAPELTQPIADVASAGADWIKKRIYSRFYQGALPSGLREVAERAASEVRGDSAEVMREVQTAIARYPDEATARGVGAKIADRAFAAEDTYQGLEHAIGEIEPSMVKTALDEADALLNDLESVVVASDDPVSYYAKAMEKVPAWTAFSTKLRELPSGFALTREALKDLARSEVGETVAGARARSGLQKLVQAWDAVEADTVPALQRLTDAVETSMKKEALKPILELEKLKEDLLDSAKELAARQITAEAGEHVLGQVALARFAEQIETLSAKQAELLKGVGDDSVEAAFRSMAKVQADAAKHLTSARETLGERTRKLLQEHDAINRAVLGIAGRKLERELIEGVVAEVGEDLRPAVTESWKEYSRRSNSQAKFLATRAEAPQQLEVGKRGRSWWDLSDTNPFYVPHQLGERLQDMISDQSLPTATRSRILDAFSGRRRHSTMAGFRDHLEQLADDLNLPREEGEILEQNDFFALWAKRGIAHARTKALQRAHQSAIEIGARLGGRWEAYKTYLDQALGPLPPGSNAYKVMAGGTIDAPLLFGTGSGKAVDLINRSVDNPEFMKVIERDGKAIVRIKWPGMGWIFKPPLTSHPLNVSFHVRNNYSSPVMAAFDPTIGGATWKDLYRVNRDSPLVRWAIRRFNKTFGTSASETSRWSSPEAFLAGKTPQERVALATSHVVKALTAQSHAEREIARKFLEHANEGVGRYSWREAFKIMDSFLGERISQADLNAGERAMGALYETASRPMVANPNAAGRFARAFKDYVEFGEQIANESEHYWRAFTLLKFLEKGWDAQSAIRRVNQLMVDYSRQSNVEAWIRATVPFARFMIGAAGWGQDIVQDFAGANRGLLGRAISPQSMGAAHRSLTSQGPAVPPEARESLALPLPWLDREGNQQFLLSLGFPQETVVAVMGVLSGRPESFRRTVLGGTHPVLKYGAELVTGKNFYFGTERGTYRKAPALLRPFAQEVPGPDGTTRYEVPGEVNEVLNASPLAGLISDLNRILDPRQGAFARAVNVLTGARIQSVDTEAERSRKLVDYLRQAARQGKIGEIQVFFDRLKPEDVPEDLREVLAAWKLSRKNRRRGLKA